MTQEHRNNLPSTGPSTGNLASTLRICLAGLFMASCLASSSADVVISEKQVSIPTYTLGPGDPNPMFYTRESYQGAQKRIYPYPFQDFLTHEKSDQTYTWLALENEYIKLGILPEIGGRLFEAVDKSNQYDFLYRQHVIKPALIGMLGAWISGGIEWCCFHHHRNTTYMPVDYTLVENPDGSKTIWFGETERRHRMKWMIGITLFPGKSYLEATVKFDNRTPLPHSILYWANVAVNVNDDYQVLFPPSVEFATYHSKIDFARWPLFTGRYRGADYDNTDMSWWKNHRHPVSFFAWHSEEDFMGGYDHSKEAGVIHVADHHIVTGAKLWEWSPSPEGRAWDQILTDKDGPYAELMVGAWSDNQPDYSWIKPAEVKVFKQYWYPIQGIGGCKNANLNGAVNLELNTNHTATLGFHVTSAHPKARVLLQCKDKTVFDKTITIDPGQSFCQEISVPSDTQETDLKATLFSEDGMELVSYQPQIRKPTAELPKTVQPPPAPEKINTTEELVLTGLRVEQIHNPTIDPVTYYTEALKRDPGDTRAHILMGQNCLKKGLNDQAEMHFRKALERLTADYTRPPNGDAYYYLGLALRGQGLDSEAVDPLYRATWDQAFHSAAYQQLAEISCQQGVFQKALDQIEQSLKTGTENSRAWNLKSAIHRKLGQPQRTLRIATGVLKTDPLNFGAMNEQFLALREMKENAKADEALLLLEQKMHGNVESYLELAVDYLNAGLLEEAITLLERPVQASMPFASTYPMVHYYLGFLHHKLHQPEKALDCFHRAAEMPDTYCFPFRFESATVLRKAIELNARDARAWYYLGNLLFESQPEQAISCWEQSRALDPNHALTHRNLGWGYYRVQNNIEKALASYENAVRCNSEDPRYFLELDSLYERANATPEKRLALLEKHHATVIQRNESFTREIAVLILCGKLDIAIDYLDYHFFHVREGEGSIHDHFVDAHLLKGLECMDQNQFKTALEQFEKASEYPQNLSVGRPTNDRRAAQVACLTGLAHEALGNADKAREQYERAAQQETPRNGAEARFYQAVCLRKLGKADEANKLADELVSTAQKQISGETDADYFAKFGEQETQMTRKASAQYGLGLGLLLKGDKDSAQAAFKKASELNQSHLWSQRHATRGSKWTGLE